MTRQVGLDLLLMVPGLPFQGDTLETGSLGGSETAALCMARELAKLGHRVVVFSNCPNPGVYDGVTYRPIAQWREYATFTPHDVSIVQRQPEAFAGRLNSRLNLLWCHDLALLRQAPPFKGALWNIDRVLVVSAWMAKQYREVYGLPEELLWTTRNGIDLARFAGLESLERDPKKLIYAARPERGLDVLMGGIMPRLLERDPALRLYLCGYNNPVEHLASFYEQIDRQIKALGDRVVWLGHLPKAELYRHYATARAYVYPTPSPAMPNFAEVSCCSAIEAMAAGLPIVTSARGALPETIGAGPGCLIGGDPWTREYQDAFVETVLEVVTDDERAATMSIAGRSRAAHFDWAEVAREWTDEMSRLIAERNDSPHRLAYHFIRRSDIMAAKAVVEPLTDDVAQEIKARLVRDWGFAESPEGIRAQYAKIGGTHTDVYESAIREPRFQMLVDWMRQHPEAQRVLDYGCGLGAYAIGAANEVGRDWVGVDIDPTTVDWCERYVHQHAKEPGRLAFLVGDQQVDLSTWPPFDCLVVFETLEHVVAPWALIESLERWVRPGGHVLLTVPFGPWEYMSYDSYPWRCHLWDFDRHDLLDLFGQKSGLQIHVMPAGFCEPLGEPLGWHVVEYRVDPARPTGRIDLARKLALQRPRQTVSASLIAGPNAEETLHWCLRSLKHVADELVITDTGLSDEGRRIAREYGARLAPGSSPLVAGFETPRNEGLARCRMDWVLWIDTDEKLIEPQNLQKYLRSNMFNGYSIRQHHFACDTTFNADLPVRCFRRGPWQGKSMRWFGLIHEHPELGLNEGPGPTIVLSDVHIPHVGYLMERGRRERFARNYPLLQRDIQAYPERILQKHFICRDNMLICGYELQQSGGKVTPEIRRRCEETIEVYRTHFLGRGGYIGVDTLQYYSQACGILGLGADVAFQVAAAKDQATPNGVIRARFATLEDAEKEIAWRTREAVTPFVSAWW
jgi:glycosyltransferase involved in cell wall biosynthesis/SAM-dependent methyltransferase